jgi:hypothetical protein
LSKFYETKTLKEVDSIIKKVDPRYGAYISIWVHPQIFIQMVQSIVPMYEVIVTDWVLQIHRQGFIDVRDQLKKTKKEYNALVVKHNSLLKKRVYSKLTEGCCVYLRTTDSSELTFKVGCTKNINQIMAGARRHFSKTLLVACIFLNEDNYQLLEKCLLVK